MHDVKVTKTIQKPNIEAFHKLKKRQGQGCVSKADKYSILYLFWCEDTVVLWSMPFSLLCLILVL